MSDVRNEKFLYFASLDNIKIDIFFAIDSILKQNYLINETILTLLKYYLGI
jgi:hypothetical protein